MKKTKYYIQKRIFSLFLATILVLAPLSSIHALEVEDMAGHWAMEVINEWLTEGLAQGYPDGNFKPDHPITRAEFIALTNRAFDFSEEEGNTFHDVLENDWYNNAIKVAIAASYIGGYPDGTLKPKAAITRQEVAIIISKIKNLENDPSQSSIFTDAHTIPEWSIGQIGAVVEAGYMSGYPDGSFRPLNPITRAEAVATLNRAIKDEALEDLEAEIEEEVLPEALPQGSPRSGRSSGGGGTTTPIVKYTVNYSVEGNNGTLTGTVTSGNSVDSGTSVTFTATPSTGYEIKEWKVNGVVTVSGSTLTRTISANTTVTVEFEETAVAPTMYTITYSVIGEGGTIEATVPNGGTAIADSSVSLTAVPEEGYKLKEWTINGEVIDWLTGLNIARDMNMDVDIKVEFEPIVVVPTIHPLTIKVDPSDAVITVTDSEGVDKQGTFNGIQTSYDLPEGMYTIRIAKAGYVTQEYTQNMVGPSSHNITLDFINNAPVATVDEVTVVNNMTILVDVLANDTDADGDTLSMTGFTQGTNGTVTQEGDSLRYKPNTNFIGMDEFQYEISDGNGGTSYAFVKVTVNPNGTKLGTGSYQGNDISFYIGDSGLIALLEGQVSTALDVIADSYTSVVDIVSMDDSVALIYMWEGNIEVSRVVAIGQNAVESGHSKVQALGVISGIKYTVDNDETIHFTYLDSQGSPDSYNRPDLMYANTNNGVVILVQRAYQDLSSSGSWGADYIEGGYTLAVDNEGNPVVAYIRRNIWKWSNGSDTTYYLHIKNPLTQENIIIESNYKTNIYTNLQLIGGGSTIEFSFDKSGVSVAGTISADPLSVDLP
ncbi:MAG: hypothetical protein CVV00_06440 [Firmicutes bacterium HGW-Firmicutes-5]|nr:MAG: hypothetical protein CVV00_06440 [Firmicutes bacterium HGW-Firmicutes-5]